MRQGKWRRGALVVVATMAAAGVAGAQVSGWPREIDHAKGTVVVYQPQPESLHGNLLRARTAVAVHLAGQEPVFGVVWLEAALAIDKTARVATATSLAVTRVRFPNAAPEQEQTLATIIDGAFVDWDKTMDYDHLLASVAAAERELEAGAGLATQPPRIIVETVPAVLVYIDGEPRLAAIPGTPVKRVVNTPLLIAFDDASGTYYLAGTQVWYRTRDVRGDWEHVAADGVPQPIRDVAAASRQQAVADGVEAADVAEIAAEAAETRVPKVVVSTEPAELIAFDGEPALTPVLGTTDLLYAANTVNKVLLDVASQRYFVLLSGRWYQAAALDGEWTFVAPEALPASFRGIPADSPIGDVLAQVPGTPQAEEAVADTYVPQTAAIKRAEAKLSVEYDGEPTFEPVPGTEVAYAVNTRTQVLKIGDRYYAVDNGVWFIADRPQGPWAVSDHNPPEVQDLPPSCPVYNTKYVYVYDSTPEIVYVGYTPGYVGCYPYYGTVVYGTGYYYPPWVGVYYYPRPPTWSLSVAYNPWTGWSVGVGYSFGPVHISFWSGGYYGGGWYHGGYPPPRPPYWGGGGYHPHPGYPPGHHPGGPGSPAGPGQRPGEGGRPEQQPAGARPETLPSNSIYDRGANKDRVATRDRPAERPGGPAVADREGQRPANRPNDVYADRDGNVYRRDDRGNWQQQAGGEWRQSAPAAGPSAGTRDAERPAREPSGAVVRRSTGTRTRRLGAPAGRPARPGLPSAGAEHAGPRLPGSAAVRAARWAAALSRPDARPARLHGRSATSAYQRVNGFVTRLLL